MSPFVSRLLLRLLPGAFRQEFGRDLMGEWRRLRADTRRTHGRLAEWRYLAREMRAFLRLVRDLRRQHAQAHRAPWGVWADVGAAWRLASRRPMGTVATVVTLTAALSASAVAFGVARAVLWRTLPFADESRLVFAWEDVSRDGAPAPARVTGGRFVDWAGRSEPVASLAAFGSTSFRVVDGDGQVTAVDGVRVSAEYFQILGVNPALGRLFDPGDHEAGADPVVVLSFDFWQRQFGGREDILGQALRTAEQTYTIIGVLPDIWLPSWPVNPARVTLNPESRQLFSPMPPDATLARNSRSHVFGVIGRIADGRTLADAERVMDARDAAHPDAHRALLRPLRDQVTGSSRSALLLLLGTTMCVWLVASFNLAAIRLAAFETRRAEFATRAALGAGWWRLARQLTAESVLVTSASVVAALAVTHGILLSLPARLPSHIPFVTLPRLDGPSLLFTGAMAAVAAAIMVVWPVRRLRSLRGVPSQRWVAPGSAAFRGMVTVQLTGTVALVVVSGLLLSSMRTLASRDLGFDTAGVSVVDAGLPGGYETPERVLAFERLVHDRLVGSGRARGVAFAYDHPLEANWIDGMAVAGAVAGTGDVPVQAELRIVSPSYFDVMGVRILEGRAFEDREGMAVGGVALVNREFVRQTPIAPGGRIRQMAARRSWGDAAPTEFEVVGIVDNERFRGVESEASPAFYLSTRQYPLAYASILVAAGSSDAGLATAIRDAVREAEPGASLGTVRPLDEIEADQKMVRTLTTDIVGGLALMALGLAGVGLHGLLTLIVSGQRQEIGIRLALGASRGHVAKRIVRDSLVPVGAGIVAGVGLAQLAGGTIRSLLVEVSVLDPFVTATVCVLMLVVGVVASAVPARSASRVDPARTLRGAGT